MGEWLRVAGKQRGRWLLTALPPPSLPPSLLDQFHSARQHHHSVWREAQADVRTEIWVELLLHCIGVGDGVGLVASAVKTWGRWVLTMEGGS